MADLYCNRCARERGWAEGDFELRDGLSDPRVCDHREVTCAGCGPCLVDWRGERVGDKATVPSAINWALWMAETSRAMTDLIERLEAGETGLETSNECLEAIGWIRIWSDWSATEPVLSRWINPAGEWIACNRTPNVTESLDDALAHMVPEGWRWRIRTLVDNQFRARLFDRAVFHGIAPTAAAAVCVAGLRARAATHLAP